jgi:hypothetical protein
MLQLGTLVRRFVLVSERESARAIFHSSTPTPYSVDRVRVSRRRMGRDTHCLWDLRDARGHCASDHVSRERKSAVSNQDCNATPPIATCSAPDHQLIFTRTTGHRVAQTALRGP